MKRKTPLYIFAKGAKIETAFCFDPMGLGITHQNERTACRTTEKAQVDLTPLWAPISQEFAQFSRAVGNSLFQGKMGLVPDFLPGARDI